MAFESHKVLSAEWALSALGALAAITLRHSGRKRVGGNLPLWVPVTLRQTPYKAKRNLLKG